MFSNYVFHQKQLITFARFCPKKIRRKFFEHPSIFLLGEISQILKLCQNDSTLVLIFTMKETSSTVQKECDGTCIVLTHAYSTPGYRQKLSTIYISSHYTHQIARAYGLTFSRACFCRLCYLMSSSLCALPQYMCVLLHMHT